VAYQLLLALGGAENIGSDAHLSVLLGNQPVRRKKSMPGNIFYIIGVIVVVLFILGYLGLR
jgi:hypothetical protein